MHSTFSISECFAFALTDKNESMGATNSALVCPAKMKEKKDES